MAPPFDSVRTARSLSGSDEAPSTSPTLAIIAIASTVGGAILIALVALTVLIAHKKAQHRRALVAVQVEEALQAAHRLDAIELPRPATVARRGTLLPLHSRAGWDALDSSESICVRSDSDILRSNIKSVPIPQKLKGQGIRLKRLHRLTAIIESPRSRHAKSPSPADELNARDGHGSASRSWSGMQRRANSSRETDEDDVACLRGGSPELNVLPSFAIGSPGRYAANMFDSDKIKGETRSRSLMTFTHEEPAESPTPRGLRPHMHTRSLSLGAPPTEPPTGPIPPVPTLCITPPQSESTKPDSNRQGFVISRLSSSSSGSGGSSVLVASPILGRTKALASPNLQEIVADHDSASLSTVKSNQWHNDRPMSTGSMPALYFVESERPNRHASVRSDIVRFSITSRISRRSSSGSTTCSDAGTRNEHRLSAPQIQHADHMSIIKASPTNSNEDSTPIVRKVATPQRVSRKVSVSVNGSPYERKKPLSTPPRVLRDISGNAAMPPRQFSDTTIASACSSNGNPFQWDLPRIKPSAMKGSPNARRGHKRQNCVRISTLTPQILGPPPSRPLSPSLMFGIEEEGADGWEASATFGGSNFAPDLRPQRDASASSLGAGWRMQSLRASLTPTSPTLSVWADHEPRQSSQLPSETSVSSFSKPISRSSSSVSAFNLSSFPIVDKASASTESVDTCDQAVPHFYLTRPSDEIEQGPYSYTTHPIETRTEWKCATGRSDEFEKLESEAPWPLIDVLPPEVVDIAEPGHADLRESPSDDEASLVSIAMSTNDEEQMQSAQSNQPPAQHNSLPSSPAILTSSTASAVMARIPIDNPGRVDFPGAPILSPPPPDSTWEPSARTVRAQQNQPLVRPTPSPPMLSPITEVSSSPTARSSPPSATARPFTPHGPRTQPPLSVLRHAVALRRMNSEVACTPCAAERRFARLGCEPSQLLLWPGASHDLDCSEGEGEEDNDVPLPLRVDSRRARRGSDESEEAVGGAIEESRRAPAWSSGGGGSSSSNAGTGGSGGNRNRDRPSSVWEDGEKYWGPPGKANGAAQNAFAPSSPYAIALTAGLKSGSPISTEPSTGGMQVDVSGGEIWAQQRTGDSGLMTPEHASRQTTLSWYDAAGFLRT